MAATNTKGKITVRERVVLWLVLLMIRILAPWEYEHQFKSTIDEIVKILKDNEE